MQWLSFTAGYEPQPWPTRARKKTQCPLPLTPQKHKGKAAAKPSPKLHHFGHRSCRTLVTAAGVSKSTRCWGTTWGWSPSRCCIARSFRPIMWPRGPKNSGKSSRKCPTAYCRTSYSRTRRNSTSSRWQSNKITEFGLPRHPQREGSSPGAKIHSPSWFGRLQYHPVLDSEENALIHKQERLACKEPWP